MFEKSVAQISLQIYESVFKCVPKCTTKYLNIASFKGYTFIMLTGYIS